MGEVNEDRALCWLCRAQGGGAVEILGAEDLRGLMMMTIVVSVSTLQPPLLLYKQQWPFSVPDTISASQYRLSRYPTKS